jgi:KUP system potassium uptake protein
MIAHEVDQGIIYADLSASPLYTLGGIWPASGPAPSEEDIIGGISCIIWALTLLPLIKYVSASDSSAETLFSCIPQVVIALEFGTSAGEGGTFALFQGLYPKRSTLSGHTLIDEGVRLARRPPPRLKWPLLLWARPVHAYMTK